MGYFRNKNNHLTDAQEKVFSVVKKLKRASPNEILADFSLEIGKAMLQRHLKKLLELGYIQKVGSPPRVWYSPIYKFETHPSLMHNIDLPQEETLLLEKYFAFTDHLNFYRGEEAFKRWFEYKQCPTLTKQKPKKIFLEEHLKTNYLKLAKKFKELRTEISASQSNTLGLIDATQRYLSIFQQRNFLEHIYYLDFFSLPQFGKSKYGFLVQKAKIGDNSSIKYINEIAALLEPAISKIKIIHNIDACLWVPHSIKRKISLLDRLKKMVATELPKISIEKVFPGDTVPQKTISDLSLRIKNAEETLLITESKRKLLSYSNVIIIDDAIGSNATIHAIAEKIKKVNSKCNLFALAPVGSYKGFEVISDI